MRNDLRFNELAILLGVNNSSITVACKSRNGNPSKLDFYVKQGKKYIDIDTLKNKTWIKEHCYKNDINDYDDRLKRLFNGELVAPLPKKTKKQTKGDIQSNQALLNSLLLEGKKSEDNSNEKAADASEDPPEKNYTNEKRKLECERLKVEIKKSKIQVEKLSGSLIPVDETLYVMGFSISNFTSSATSHMINALGLIVKELGGTDDDYKRHSETFRSGLVSFSDDAQKELIDGVDGIVEQYREVRGRGERK